MLNERPQNVHMQYKKQEIVCCHGIKPLQYIRRQQLLRGTRNFKKMDEKFIAKSILTKL